MLGQCMTDPKDYYRKIVLDYLVGDIEHLLKNQERRAGLVLYPVLAGIDTIGGMIHGFSVSSKRRSIDFLENYLQLDRSIATFLYESLRCGLVHQGTSKVGLKFFTLYGDLNRFSIVYSGEENWVYLDATALAMHFCRSARKIYQCFPQSIVHCPPIEQASFSQIDLGSLKSISELLHDYAAEQTCATKTFENGIIRRVCTSISYYTPDQILNQCLVVEPSPDK